MRRQGFWVPVLLLLSGCEKEEHKAAFTTRERSQAVVAAPNTVPAAGTPATTAAEASKPAPVKVRRRLCDGRLENGSKGLPKQRVSRVETRAERETRTVLTPSKAGLTWINFWAAWCEPCKEEIPRLVAWEQKLGKKLTLAFVSIDDDERQLRSFLGSRSDLRVTYWLKEGKEREDWLIAAGLDPDPELPMHLLVDREGKIRCKVQGAVEDADFADLVRLLEGEDRG